MRRIFLLVALLVLPLLFFWATAARRNAANRVTDWLPAGSQELEDFLEFHGHFGESELLMASWDGALLGDPHLAKIAKRVTASHGTSITGTQEPYFIRVVTSDDIFKSLTSPPLELSRTEAKRRLRGWLLGRDKDTACLVAFISYTGLLHRADAINAVAHSIREETGLGDSQIYIAGPTIDSVAIDQVTAASQQRLVPIFLCTCLVLLLVALRSFAAAVAVFFIAATNEELGAALVHLTGGQMDSISLLIGSLVYVLTISAGVHLANYYRETLRIVPPKLAPWATVRKAAVPCTLATVTTILGLLSLAGSKMVPIRNFGIYASLALGIGTLWLFAVFLAAAREFPINNWQQKDNKNNADLLHALWQRVALFVERWHRIIVLVGVTMMIVLAAGLPHLKTSVTFHGMFPESAKVIQDYNALEEQIGGLIPIEVILTIPNAQNTSSIVDQLLLVRETARRLEHVAGVDSVMAAPQFVPTIPTKTAGGAKATMLRSSLQSVLPHYTDELEASRFLKCLPNGDWLWRISLRIRAGENLSYDELLTDIREEVARVISQHVDVKYIVTGGVPLVHKAQDQLLRDLIQSFFIAFVTIGVTMMVLLRGVVRGLVSMVPNVFPCIVVFGAMAWGGYAVDMGSMMTASVAMGIAVDGTLHFMTWFHRGMREGQDRAAAVRGAYQHCATALTQTTVICGLGMLVFCASDFLPVAYFAKMLCFLLIFALIGDLVILPAMLFGRIGRVFQSAA